MTKCYSLESEKVCISCCQILPASQWAQGHGLLLGRGGCSSEPTQWGMRWLRVTWKNFLPLKSWLRHNTIPSVVICLSTVSNRSILFSFSQISRTPAENRSTWLGFSLWKENVGTSELLGRLACLDWHFNLSVKLLPATTVSPVHGGDQLSKQQPCDKHLVWQKS